jgi:transglutaminase superfamily protein
MAEMRRRIAELAVATEVAAEYGRVRWLLRRRGLAATLEVLRRPRWVRAGAPGRDQRGHALFLARFATRGLAALPAVEATCLTRSLVVTGMLARRGIPTSLTISVSSPENFAAHAWVEWEGEPLLDTGDHCNARLATL